MNREKFKELWRGVCSACYVAGKTIVGLMWMTVGIVLVAAHAPNLHPSFWTPYVVMYAVGLLAYHSREWRNLHVGGAT